jgi:hypothetical protein
MRELMISMTYPGANDILLAISRAPQSDKEWVALQRSAILLAESGNLLTMRGRAYDQGAWMKHARMLADAGAAAYKASRAKDMAALSAVSEPLNTSCVACHQRGTCESSRRSSLSPSAVWLNFARMNSTKSASRHSTRQD